MLNIIAVIFVFSVLVIIHELGHFLAARWMGVRVEKFSIGFPPTIYRKKLGETEFSISAIPLGGYVKMAGFIDESMDENITGADYEFNSKPVWKRIVIITAGVIMNLVLAVALLTSLNLIEGERITPVTKIGYVGEGGIAEKIGFQKYDKILFVNEKKISNWNQVHAAFIDNLNQDITFRVLRSDAELDLLYKREWFSEEKGEQLDIGAHYPAKVGDVTPGMPAETLGLHTGDLITSVGGKDVDGWIAMTDEIRGAADTEVDITWMHSGKLMQGRITPQAFEETNEAGEIEKVGKVGISLYFEHQDIGFLRAVRNGFTNTYDLIVLNMRSLYWVISGTKSAKEVIGGPIMIAKMAGDAAHAGIKYLLYLIAALSAVLAFFNVLPIPGLDGGHLVFLIFEGILGKPIPVKVKIKIQQVGMAILLSLIIFVVYIDIKRLLF